MEIPKNLVYSKSHEWVKLSGSSAEIGITDYAQHALSDIVFVNLPMVGDTVNIGESFCEVESVKAVSEVFSPVTGTVTAVNEELLDAPENLNNDPYGAWMIKVKFSEVEELLDADQYEELCKEEG